MWSAGKWLPNWQHYAAQAFHEPGVRIEERRSGRHKAFFYGISAAVLHPHDGRNRELTLPKGIEMVMPGDNVNLEVEINCTSGAGTGFKIRNSRRRPDCWRWCHYQDLGIKENGRFRPCE